MKELMKWKGIAYTLPGGVPVTTSTLDEKETSVPFVGHVTAQHAKRSSVKEPKSPCSDTNEASFTPPSRDIPPCTRRAISLTFDLDEDICGPRHGYKKVPLTGQWGRTVPPVSSSGDSTPVLSPKTLSNKIITELLPTSISSSSTIIPKPKSPKISESVVNSPSTTPPPNISTALDGKILDKSVFETLDSLHGLATPSITLNSGSENTIAESSGTTTSAAASFSEIATSHTATSDKEEASGNAANKETGAHAPLVIRHRPSIIITTEKVVVAAPEVVLPQLTMTNASSSRMSHNLTATPSTPICSGAKAMKTSGSQAASSDSSPDIVSAETTAVSMSTSSSLSLASPTSAAAQDSSSTIAGPAKITDPWSKRKPLSPEGIILRPVSIQTLSAPKEDEALFLPTEADRTWYTGFLEPWKSFNKEATKYWKSAHCRDAFDELKIYPMTPPPSPNPQMTETSHGPEILYSHFQREVLEVMQRVYLLLMDTATMQNDKQPNEIYLGKAEDEDLSNDESKWDPSFIIKASKNTEDEATRVLGQVEYLGGRKAALTWAISEQYKNTWGSLRCVLGEAALISYPRALY